MEWCQALGIRGGVEADTTELTGFPKHCVDLLLAYLLFQDTGEVDLELIEEILTGFIISTVDEDEEEEDDVEIDLYEAIDGGPDYKLPIEIKKVLIGKPEEKNDYILLGTSAFELAEHNEVDSTLQQLLSHLKSA